MSLLTVSEWFTSIQGEGCEAGIPAIFLRLSGCNLRCKFCDTVHAWEEGSTLTVDEASKRILSSRVADVVVTGGEPMLQAEALKKLLASVGERKRFHLETNGTIWNRELLEMFHLVTISPKLPSMAKKGLEHEVLDTFHSWDGPLQVKVLVSKREDWEGLDTLVERYPRWGREVPLVVQPLCTTEESIGEYLLNAGRLACQFTAWAEERGMESTRFMPQLHKVLWWGEERR